ncbi:cytochrome P450 [Phascolomyces articulosus]|uniref:Cytochrome P450 n=1 Tax=Phascolomyces articulosus TaxID=60185 RepID=A0AAD5PEP6_9FUNG|nr:cytochrome P450 [Phascolomyces articulosus]
MGILTDSWNRHIVQNIPDNTRHFLEEHKGAITLGAVLFGFYLGYEKVSRPPKKLRHIPNVPFLGYLKGFLKGVTINEVATEITLPVALKSEEGLYTRLDQNGWSVHITRPEAAKKFLMKTDLFRKHDPYPERHDTLFAKFALGPNVLFLNGPEWKKQRMIANPAFHRSMPIELFGRLTQRLFKVMDASSNPIDFHDMMERWTLEAIGLAGFDFEFNALEDTNNEWVLTYNDVITGIRDPLFTLFPKLDTWFLPLFPKRQELHREVKKLSTMLSGIIDHKRAILRNNKEENIRDSEKDLLTLLLEAGKEDEKDAMTDEELLSNLCIFFLAGHDTTANALSFAAYYLAVNPDVQQKAREESIRVLGDDPKDIIPNAEQLKEMPYINMVMKEVLRMDGPAATVVVREATQDTDLCGVFIPKGARLQLDIYQLHHNPTVWNNPEKFDPERFAPGGEAEHNGLAWMPFSQGSRQCIGMNFSLAEQRVMLSMLLRKYEFSLPENSVHKKRVLDRGFGVISPKELEINFHKRY